MSFRRQDWCAWDASFGMATKPKKRSKRSPAAKRGRRSGDVIPRFTWSDAWLLFAVSLAATSGTVTLKDVIACGDGIQHAIFTPAELRRGFAKLIACGHIRHRGETFEVSAGVREILASTRQRRIAMRTLQKRFETFLAAAPYPAGDPQAEDPDWPFPRLTDAMVDRAVKAYHQDFRRHLRTD